jgi:hypothetical protein
VVDVRTGRLETYDADGIVSAVASDGSSVAAVEEPVRYHDEDRERGRYRLFRASLD